MPSDGLVSGPAITSTRAITIGSRTGNVWPWIAQMGAGRAGWYAFDQIDNGGRPSARIVLPELQQIRVGDLLPATLGDPTSFRIAAMEPFRSLVLVEAAADGKLRMSWELRLEAWRGGRCRLIARTRISREWPRGWASSAVPGAPALTVGLVRMLPRRLPLPAPLLLRAAVLGHAISERMTLLGIRSRAERQLERFPSVTDRVALVDRLIPRAAVADMRQAEALRPVARVPVRLSRAPSTDEVEPLLSA